MAGAKRRQIGGRRSEVGGGEFEEAAFALAAQNLERDVTSTDWNRMSQLREEIIGQESVVIGEEAALSKSSSFKIQNLKFNILPHLCVPL
jgi:hypothetical protein